MLAAGLRGAGPFACPGNHGRLWQDVRRIMADKCAPGVLDWQVHWHVQENRVTVEVDLASKEQAAGLADELADRLRGPDATVPVPLP